jgi:recombination protein RecA
MNLKEVSKETKKQLLGERYMDLDKFDKQFLGQGVNIECPIMPTGIDALDSALGGGIMLGHHIELWGKEKAGKTLLSIIIASAFQKAGKKVMWADLEGRFVPSWAEKWGVDTDKLLKPINCTFAEQFMDLFIVRTIRNDVDLIIIDSIPKFAPKAVLDKMTGEKTMGSKPALLSLAMENIDAYRQEHLSNGKIPPTFIWINQVREKIGGYSMHGTPETTPGGHCIAHAFSQVIKLKVKGDGFLLKDGKETATKTDPNVVGYTAEGQIMKNILTQSDRIFNYKINLQDHTIDNLSSLIEIKKDFVRKGAWFYLDFLGKDFVGQTIQGEANFRQKLLENPAYIEKLRKYEG